MDWIVAIVIIAAFAGFIYHRKQSKVDNKTLGERVGGVFKGRSKNQHK